MPNEYTPANVLRGIIHIYSKSFMFMSHKDSHDFQSGRRHTPFMHFNVPLWIQNLREFKFQLPPSV